MGTEVNGAEVMLGRGKVYIDRLTSSFARTGEVFVGNVSALEITPSPEEIKKFSSATAAAPQTCSDVIRQSLALRIVGDEFSKENLARALYGDTSTISQTGSSVTAEPVLTVQQDRYYPLDYRVISAVVVKDSVPTTYTVTDDYIVDAVEGRIYIVPGGAIADDTNLLIDYTYGTIALNTVRGMNQTSIRCFIRFVGDPARGATQTLEIWRASVRADGPIGLIGDDYMEWTLTGDVESDATNHPDEPHFRIIRVVEPS
jgi:hypothetical protein